MPDTILDTPHFDKHIFEQARGEWTARARSHARAIAREKGEVTIDDVRGYCPPPEDADPRIMGSVFTRAEFVRVGFRLSARKACHGRFIGVFRLRGG